MKNSNSTTSLIRDFIYKQFPIAKQRKISNDEPLLDSGVVDSLGILEIVNFVEDEFKITVSDEDLLPDNFNSIQTLVIFVEQKLENCS